MILDGTESFSRTEVMSFQVEIGFLGGIVFFQVGLCTPLQTMDFELILGCGFMREFSSSFTPQILQLPFETLIHYSNEFKN